MAPKEIERLRKAAEGELRNNYFKASSPVKKRLSEVEAGLEKSEREFRELEAYFANPDNYGDNAKITGATRRHGELKTLINLLTQEWENLSYQAERLQVEFENAKNNLSQPSTSLKLTGTDKNSK